MLNNVANKGGVIACNNQAIDINQEMDEHSTVRVNKEGRVHTGGDKAEREQEGVELLVPSLRSQFEPINSLV